MGGIQKELDEVEVRAIIDEAISSGAEIYVRECENRIAGFVHRHYSFRGALEVHARALGWDVIRVPVNIVWSVVNIFLALIGFIAGLVRLKKLRNWIRRIPPGLETNMDRQISWLIVTELLELPYEQAHRVSANDSLMAAILENPKLRTLINEVLDTFDVPSKSPDFIEKLDRKLAEYAATRTASSDLASSATLLVISKIALGQASFGALSAGTAVAATVAHSAAVSNFWLGSTAGSYYYAIFPVAASVRLLVAVTAVIAVALALVSTFIGILTDPIQAKLGIHQRRLRKFVSAIGDDLRAKSDSEFQLREKYAGRLFDIVDVLSAVGRSL